MARIKTERLESGAIRFTVPGIGGGSRTFDPRLAHEANRTHAEFHGWKQRIGDGAALECGPDGKPASAAVKLDRMGRIIDWYETGTDQWRMDTTGGGGQSIVVQAYQRVQNVATYDMAKGMIERRAEARGETYEVYLKVVAALPPVQDAIVAIQRERLPVATLDADEALSELQAAQ